MSDDVQYCLPSVQQRPAKDRAIAIAIIVQRGVASAFRNTEHGTRIRNEAHMKKWLGLAADGAGLVYVWGTGGGTPTALLSASSCKGGGIQPPPSSTMTLGSQRERDWEGTLYVSAVLQGSGVTLQQQVRYTIYFMFCVCSASSPGTGKR